MATPYEVTGREENSVSFDIACIDPARGSVESDCFQIADWTIAEAVETFCSEYDLEPRQICVEWNCDADDDSETDVENDSDIL